MPKTGDLDIFVPFHLLISLQVSLRNSRELVVYIGTQDSERAHKSGWDTYSVMDGDVSVFGLEIKFPLLLYSSQGSTNYFRSFLE